MKLLKLLVNKIMIDSQVAYISPTYNKLFMQGS